MDSKMGWKNAAFKKLKSLGYTCNVILYEWEDQSGCKQERIEEYPPITSKDISMPELSRMHRRKLPASD